MKMSWADDLTASTMDSLPSMSFDDDAFHDGRYEHIGANASAIEIELEPEVFGALSRRGRRRRLREIQSVFPVCLRLDRHRKLLHAIGEPEALEAVQEQIESLRGPRKTVSSAVWAELMRTRVLQDDSSALYRLEQASGCRIHIERKLNEVRLFGPPEASSKADKLLDEFVAEVTELKFDLDTGSISEESLHALAHSCGVTLRVENGQVMMYGTHDNVDKAAQEFERYRSSPDKQLPFSGVQVMTQQVPENFSIPNRFHQEDPKNSSMMSGPCFPSGTAFAPPVHMQQMTGPAPMQAYSASSYAPYQQQLPVGNHVCATCGCGHFCTSCGTQISGWHHVQNHQMLPANPSSVPNYSYPADTMFVQMMVAQPGPYFSGTDSRASQ